MVPRNSLEERFLLDSFVAMLDDISSHLPDSDRRSLEKDKETLKSRVTSEGVSFLTISLPRLGKSLDKGLETRQFAPCNGFKSEAGRKTPRFLSACFRALFDRSGSLVDVAPPQMVAKLRQFLFCAYKYELPSPDAKKAAVLAAFLATEDELNALEIPPSKEIDTARSIIARVLRDFNPRDILPRHGPGAVATGEVDDQKWSFARKYRKIHQVYPYYEYFVVGNGREVLDRLQWYKSLIPQDEGTAKVLLVPKDSRGPRLISCEPLEYQWIQQGLGRKLVETLEASSLTGGQVNFSDQSVNRRLALESSLSGEFATLDLKEASDRVSLDLVRMLFPADVFRALDACRTSATQLPDGTVVPLKKFAPMGSALCFPVEALVFWALSVASVVVRHEVPLQQAVKAVYVYGDDIICRRSTVSTVMSVLESVGLVVNRDKSFVSGSFRESCGMDAFKGVCVTPIRFRTRMTFNARDGRSYVSLIAAYNQFAKTGWSRTAGHILSTVEKLWGPVPYSSRGDAPEVFKNRETIGSGSSVLRFTIDGSLVTSQMRCLQLNEQKGIRMRSVSSTGRLYVWAKTLHTKRTLTQIDGWRRLLRNQTLGEGPAPHTYTSRRDVGFVTRRVYV